jgi:hypothetical protein
LPSPWLRQKGIGWQCVEREQQRERAAVFRRSRLKGSDLALASSGIAEIGGDLDQGRAAFRIAGNEIHFVPILRSDVAGRIPAPFEFKKYGGFGRVPKIGDPSARRAR